VLKSDGLNHLLIEINGRFEKTPEYPRPYPAYMKRKDYSHYAEDSNGRYLATLPECYHKQMINAILVAGKTHVLDVPVASNALIQLASTEALATYVLDNHEPLRM
jgi:hypothetical protein